MSATKVRSSPQMLPWLSTTIKLILGGLALAAITVQLTSWQELQATLATTQSIYLAGCIGVYFVGVWISCVKWQLLLAILGARASMATLFRWYLAGAFAGNLLPSDIGGDVVRGYLASRVVDDQTAVWSSILAERLTGLIGLALLTVFAVVVLPTVLGWSPWLVIVGLCVLASISIGSIALLLRTDAVEWTPAAKALATVRLVLAAYIGHPGELLLCLGYSLLYHLLTVVSLWLVLLSLAPETPLSAALVSPIAGLIGLLPLTPGGLGVREGVLAAMLGRVGVAGSVAVATALVSRILLWLVALSGLPVLLAEPGLIAQVRRHRRS